MKLWNIPIKTVYWAVLKISAASGLMTNWEHIAILQVSYHFST